MPTSKHFYIRRIHRYLGVILGIQFLLWTIGGLYFSWSNIDEVHGDFQHKHVPLLAGSVSLASPSLIADAVQHIDSIHSCMLVNILGQPFYSMQYYSGGKLNRVLADGTTGKVRAPLTKNEAIQVAAASFSGMPALKSVAYITNSNGHHEYREKPLPAWAVTFDHPTNTTVYVSSEIGRVESFRNDKWRIFDFLWMMHTMDYQSRDNINNWLLRAFSIFGLLTVMSGFILYVVSSRRFKKKSHY